LDFLLAFLSGLATGVLGALPFLHTNLILQFAQDFLASNALALFTASLAFSHLVFETIPTLFFALPAQNQNISLLPAQSLVLSGKTIKAFKIITQSLFYGVLIALALLPFALAATPTAQTLVQPIQGIALLAVITLAFYKNGLRNKRKLALSTFFFALAGLLGLTVLSLPIAREPLFPLLTGLFGIPAILFSLKREQKEYEHEEKKEKNENEKNEKNEKEGDEEGESEKSENEGDESGKRKHDARKRGSSFNNSSFNVNLKLVFYAVLAASASVLLPTLTPALVAGLLFAFTSEDRESFLTASSAVVGAKMVFDFAAVYSIGKARSGAAAVIQNAFAPVNAGNANAVSLSDLIAVEAAGAAAFFIALALLLVLGKQFTKHFRKLDANAVRVIVLVAVIAATFFISGAGGILILASASALGAGVSLSGIRKSYAIGALAVPSLSYFFGLNTLFLQAIL